MIFEVTVEVCPCRDVWVYVCLYVSVGTWMEVGMGTTAKYMTGMFSGE